MMNKNPILDSTTDRKFPIPLYTLVGVPAINLISYTLPFSKPSSFSFSYILFSLPISISTFLSTTLYINNSSPLLYLSILLLSTTTKSPFL